MYTLQGACLYYIAWVLNVNLESIKSNSFRHIIYRIFWHPLQLSPTRGTVHVDVPNMNGFVKKYTFLRLITPDQTSPTIIT